VITAERLIRPESLKEALKLMEEEPEAALLGGGAFLRLPDRHYSTLLDLQELVDDSITEENGRIRIGAYATLRSLETHPLAKERLDGMLSRSVRDVVGVQLRNIATVGGTVCGRYGFSDLITALLALKARCLFFRQGETSLEDFLASRERIPDILEAVILPDRRIRGSFQAFRNSLKDFAFLNVAVVREGSDVRIAVGGRPAVAALARGAMDTVSGQAITEELARLAGGEAAAELTFRGNLYASGEYRRELCRILVTRGLLEVGQ